MDKFKLETSFQFPFFKINELVSYSEVKNPSGIAYMILVLIKESKYKTFLLTKLLENFGVPRPLHYIYADTINNLISQEILTMRSGVTFSKKKFDSYSIFDFEFTVKGQKIFAEESIPTGVIKEEKIPVYYDIALKSLALNISNSLEPKPLSNSAINDNFMEQFECSKSIEDFLNRNKGIDIPLYENGKIVRHALIKKEEIITNVEKLSQENWTGKRECTMTIDCDNLSFEFDDKAIQKFFFEYYTSDIVNKFINYKAKFKFASVHAKGLKLSNFADNEIASVLIPKEIDDVLKQKGEMLITKGNYLSNNYFVVEAATGLQKYNSSCEFVIIDQTDNKYAFIPGVFDFTNNELGIISIPLVLKLKLKDEQLKEILNPYIDNLKNYSEDNFKVLVKITSISKNYEKAEEVMSGYLNDDYERNIVILNEMKLTAALNSNILSKYKTLLNDNYLEYLKSVNEDNLETALKITNSIPKFLNISPKQVLEILFNNLKNIKYKEKVYEIFVGKGFDKSLVVLYVNPVVEALKTKKATEKSLLDLINYDDCINDLKIITQISDYKKYTYDFELIDRTEFKKCFTTAKTLEKSVDFFKNQNEELFQTYNGFMSLFEIINDDFNLLEAALKNPKNIKPELIEKKITSGDYQFVFVNMSAKLEIILKNKFHLEGRLSDMLTKARSSGLFKRKIATDLHDFRENRNAYIHPEDRTSKFNADDLRRWSKEIFSLEEKENESSSDD